MKKATQLVFLCLFSFCLFTDNQMDDVTHRQDTAEINPPLQTTVVAEINPPLDPVLS